MHQKYLKMTWNKSLICLLVFIGSMGAFAQNSKEEASEQLDRWHKAAAEADFNTYFDLMVAPGVFVGTDATEHWDLESFKRFSKPYFDKGKAWSFTPIERHLYLTDSNNTAYFDELLETHMGICRGSGVMRLDNGKWKVAHYVLSIAVPNENVDELNKLKKETDSLLIERLKKNY
jgi:ketosteroid isomerase-like protein